MFTCPQVAYYTQTSGRPMSDYESLVQMMEDLGTPGLSTAHRNINAGWEMADSCARVELDELKAKIHEDGCMMALTVDTSEARGGIYYLDVEVRL